MTTPPPADQQGTHFWFVAIQTPAASGYNLGHYWGTVTPGAEATRLDLFNWLISDVYERNPRARGGSVIAFDIQPNKL